MYGATVAQVAARRGSGLRLRKQPPKGRGIVPVRTQQQGGAARFATGRGDAAGRPFSSIPTFRAARIPTRYSVL